MTKWKKEMRLQREMQKGPALFEEQMNMKTGEKAADAFWLCLCADIVNYSTVTCSQGTSAWRVRTFPDGDIGYTRFFNKMFDAGIVERVASIPLNE